MYRLNLGLLVAMGAAVVSGQVHQHPGGKILPSENYVHVVSEAVSPIQQVYIKSKDGMYVAAAIRKPAGIGPFPTLIYFHGYSGGRGMEQLVSWSRGDTGGPIWERFLKEGFAVVVADYRNVFTFAEATVPIRPDAFSYVDDGAAVLDYVRKLPYVDTTRITLYGSSMGGNLVAHLIGRTQVYKAVLAAPAVMGLLGAPEPHGSDNVTIDLPLARKNVDKIACPVLILVGTIDSLLPVERQFYELIEAAGKPVRMEIYENGYHGFTLGPQGQNRKEPLLDVTLDALDAAVKFAK